MKTTTTLTRAWLRRAILCMAACLVPFNLASAQDFEAIERRLGAGVEAGELTLDQAKIMFDSLKRAHGAGRELEAKKRKFEEVTRKIKAAVAEGVLSKADAEKKLDAVRHEMFGHGGSGEHRDREMEAKKRKYMEVAREIEAAVEAGKLSKEEAERKLDAMRRKMFGKGDTERRD